jgi:tetratricopeptide (TPR) repeat protein
MQPSDAPRAQPLEPLGPPLCSPGINKGDALFIKCRQSDLVETTWSRFAHSGSGRLTGLYELARPTDGTVDCPVKLVDIDASTLCLLLDWIDRGKLHRGLSSGALHRLAAAAKPLDCLRLRDYLQVHPRRVALWEIKQRLPMCTVALSAAYFGLAEALRLEASAPEYAAVKRARGHEHDPQGVAALAHYTERVAQSPNDLTFRQALEVGLEKVQWPQDACLLQAVRKAERRAGGTHPLCSLGDAYVAQHNLEEALVIYRRAAAAADGPRRGALCRLAWFERDPQLALDAAQQAPVGFPDDLGGNLAGALAYRRNGLSQQALACANRAVDLSPTLRRAHLERALGCVEVGLVDTCHIALREAEALGGRDADWHFVAGCVAPTLAAAREALCEALQLDTFVAIDRQAARLKLAEQDRALNNYLAALGSVEAVLRDEPTHRQARLLLAELLVRLRDPLAALEVYRGLHWEGRTDFASSFGMATLLHSQQRWAEASDAWQTAAHFAPGHATVLDLLACSYAQQGLFTAALQTYAQLPQLGIGSVLQLQRMRTQVVCSGDTHAGTLSLCDQLIALQQDDASLHLKRARCLWPQQAEAAVAACADARRLDPQVSVHTEQVLYNDLARARLAQGDEGLSEALVAAQLADFVTAMLAGGALLRRGKQTAALAAFDCATELQPNNAVAHVQTAAVLEALQRFGEAQRSRQRATELGLPQPLAGSPFQQAETPPPLESSHSFC